MLVNFATEFIWDKFIVFNEKVTGRIEKLFNKNKNEILVVGAGISGLTAARILAEAGYHVRVLEKRATVGGNVYDYVDENGITVQLYGPHIFHTSDQEVYEFLSNYTQWVPYEHRVLGYIDGKYVPVPFNLTSLEALYPAKEAKRIRKILTDEIGLGKKVPILQLKQHPDKAIRDFAQFVYEKVFYTYTKKQWGFEPEELGETVMNRVPVYVSFEDRYFTDTYQYQPQDGFTKLAENLLNHPNITVQTDTDALESIKIENDTLTVDGKKFGGKVIFTGRIDELFQKKYGELPYRSLDFVFETHDTASYQPAAVVNYTTSEDYTRISEFTKFCCEPKEKTVIVKEYSKACGDGDIPYYPIPKQEFLDEYAKYLEDAQKVKNLYLLGRLACYRYMNMDVAVKSAMELAEQIKKG
ncbi:MAG: UDP-galactopyranose mutase [Clostridia bacterium]|nr:UDP-galactopyranose mutase [Clostridia bacterium]